MIGLDRAIAAASEVVARLRPYSRRLQVVGSIRRGKPLVRDIDLLAIPEAMGPFLVAVREIGPLRASGDKILRCSYVEIPLDIYLATPETWATLMLIRTGSAEHNAWLATMAKMRGWRLKADGQGLLDTKGRQLAGRTEESFFEAFRLQYREPYQREQPAWLGGNNRRLTDAELAVLAYEREEEGHAEDPRTSPAEQPGGTVGG